MHTEMKAWLAFGAPTVKEMSDAFDTVNAKAKQAFGQGQYADAIHWYTAVIELEPDRHTAYTNRAACLFHLERFAEAAQDAAKSVEINPQWTKVSDPCHPLARHNVYAQARACILARRKPGISMAPHPAFLFLFPHPSCAC